MNNKKGFTLVELAVVIVIIGVLAAFGVPRFREAVERSKAGEAFSYLAAVRSAQERYHSRQGTYAIDTNELDINFPAPKYFSLGTVAGGADGIEASWDMAFQTVITFSSIGFVTL